MVSYLKIICSRRVDNAVKLSLVIPVRISKIKFIYFFHQLSLQVYSICCNFGLLPFHKLGF